MRPDQSAGPAPGGEDVSSDKSEFKVLEAIVARSYAALTADTYTLRAREGGHRKS